MLKEQARVVALERDAIWVETVQLSTCGSCTAKKGCGQALLAGLGAKPNYLRVLLDDSSSSRYRLNQSITIGLPESIVVKASLFLYLLPLLLMLMFAAVAQYFSANEPLTILMAVCGLLGSGLLVRFFSDKYKNDQRFQPKVVEEELLTFKEFSDIAYGSTP